MSYWTSNKQFKSKIDLPFEKVMYTLKMMYGFGVGRKSQNFVPKNAAGPVMSTLAKKLYFIAISKLFYC